MIAFFVKLFTLVLILRVCVCVVLGTEPRALWMLSRYSATVDSPGHNNNCIFSFPPMCLSLIHSSIIPQFSKSPLIMFQTHWIIFIFLRTSPPDWFQLVLAVLSLPAQMSSCNLPSLSVSKIPFAYVFCWTLVPILYHLHSFPCSGDVCPPAASWESKCRQMEALQVWKILFFCLTFDHLTCYRMLGQK